jgi:glycosyltransferase involved in cell wall biosynthesis
MKILMALDYYRPNVSGLSLYVEHLTEALAAKGHTITVLTHRHRQDLPAEEGDGLGLVRVVRAPVLFRLGKALVSPALLSAAWREMAQAEVLHLHAPLVTAVPLALMARARRLPFVVTYHCDLRTPPGLVSRIVETIARFSQNFAMDRAARVITYTEDYAKNTSSLAQRSDRVGWILPPVPDPPASALSPQDVRAKYGIPGRPVLLFLGRFAEEKGLPELLTAFAEIRRRFQGAQLVLAGEKDSVPGETVGARLGPLLADEASGVTATGLVPPDKVSELFSITDVLVLPSINSTESFGLVQVEGMLCGVPSVASDLPGVRQPVTMTGMGAIAPIKDAEGLARQILSVLENPERYRRSREDIRKTFSLDRTVSDYERVYGAITGREGLAVE